MLPAPNAPAPRRRRLTPWLIGALLAVLLAAALVAVVARHDGGNGAQLGAGRPSTTAGSAPAQPVAPSPSTPPSAPVSPVPAGLRKVFDELQAQTAEIRHLQWRGPLDL